MTTPEVSLSLKLLIDKKAQKVLFAEADKDFVDFLFSLLSLPLGTVVRLHKSHGMEGCLPNLYESVENLSNTYMQPNQNKDCLLNPKSATSVSQQIALLLPSDASTPRKYHICRSCYNHVTDNPGIDCPDCGREMSFQVTKVAPNASSTGEGGYVKGVVTYMVMDHLVVTPMSNISSITLLNKLNVKDLSALEEVDVDFGMEEGLELLRASLQSSTVLTHIFLGKEEE